MTSPRSVSDKKLAKYRNLQFSYKRGKEANTGLTLLLANRNKLFIMLDSFQEVVVSLYADLEKAFNPKTVAIVVYRVVIECL